MIEHMHSKVGAQALKRLRKLGGAAGWSLEHFAAASGDVDMVRWQPEGASHLDLEDIMGMLRDRDLSLVEEHGDDLRRKLCEELEQRIPSSEASCRDGGSAAADGPDMEVDRFVGDFLQLAQARLVQTPLSDRQESPLDVVGKYSIFKKIYNPSQYMEESSGLLPCLLRQSEKERNQRSDELTNVPWHWVPLCAAVYLLFVAMVFILLPWGFTVHLLGSLWGFSWLLQRVPSLVSLTVLGANTAAAWWWTNSLKQQVGAGNWNAALATLSRRVYIFAAKQRGWRVPLAKEAEQLEDRCTKTLAGWTARVLRRQMVAHVAAGQVSPEEALVLMANAAAGQGGPRKTAAMPGSISETQAWLSLPCTAEAMPGGASGQEGSDSEEQGVQQGRQLLGYAPTGVSTCSISSAFTEALHSTQRTANADPLAASFSTSSLSTPAMLTLPLGGLGAATSSSMASSGPRYNQEAGELAARQRSHAAASGSGNSAGWTPKAPAPAGATEEAEGGQEQAQPATTTVRDILRGNGWGFAKRGDRMMFRRLATPPEGDRQSPGLLIEGSPEARQQKQRSQRQQEQRQGRTSAAGVASPPSTSSRIPEPKCNDPTYRAPGTAASAKRKKGGRRR